MFVSALVSFFVTLPLNASASVPTYKSTTGITGTLKAIGSDSMNNEMALWTEGFRKFYSGVKIEVEGKGSATAPPALIQGSAHLGPMSRPMKQEEIDSFKQKFGYPPTAVKTSLDVLAIYVHKDNPLKSISLVEVDAIFSATRKSGHPKDIKTWGDLGLTGDWANKPIQLYGRNSASGTYGFFKDHALAKGDFKSNVKEQAGSSAVVQAITNDKYGIGYSGIGYLTAGVKPLPLANKVGETSVTADKKHAYDGTYPLARFLLLYVNKSPTEALDPLRGEFLKFILSKQGQESVEKEGYIPLTADMIDAERKKLGLK